MVLPHVQGFYFVFVGYLLGDFGARLSPSVRRVPVLDAAQVQRSLRSRPSPATTGSCPATGRDWKSCPLITGGNSTSMHPRGHLALRMVSRHKTEWQKPGLNARKAPEGPEYGLVPPMRPASQQTTAQLLTCQGTHSLFFLGTALLLAFFVFLLQARCVYFARRCEFSRGASRW